MINQYLFAVSAQRLEAEEYPSMSNKIVVTYAAGVVVAQNEDEAIGKAIRLATKKWPAEEGYFGWTTTSVQDISENSLAFAQDVGWRPPGEDG